MNKIFKTLLIFISLLLLLNCSFKPILKQQDFKYSVIINKIEGNKQVNKLIINNFNKLKNNIYNLGLSSANITKIQLAQKIKKYIKDLNIKIIKNRKDPDKRDYYVSNRKIERHGFKAKVSLDAGIKELIKIFNYCDVKFKNNY